MRGNTVEGRWVPEWPCGAALLTWAFSCLAYHARLLSHVRLFVTPWTIARQAPLSKEFPRKEYWSGLSFPPPGDLPDPLDQTDVSCISCIGIQVLYHQAALALIEGKQGHRVSVVRVSRVLFVCPLLMGV